MLRGVTGAHADPAPVAVSVPTTLGARQKHDWADLSDDATRRDDWHYTELYKRACSVNGAVTGLFGALVLDGLLAECEDSIQGCWEARKRLNALLTNVGTVLRDSTDDRDTSVALSALPPHEGTTSSGKGGSNAATSSGKRGKRRKQKR